MKKSQIYTPQREASENILRSTSQKRQTKKVVPPVDPTSLQQRTKKVRSTNSIGNSGKAQSSHILSRVFKHQHNQSASRTTNFSTSGSYISSQNNQSANKVRNRDKQNEQHQNQEEFELSNNTSSTTAIKNSQSTSRVSKPNSINEKQHPPTKVKEYKSKFSHNLQIPTNQKFQKKFIQNKKKLEGENQSLKQSYQPQQSNLFQNSNENTQTIKNVSVASSFKQSLVESENFNNIEEIIQSDTQVGQKTMKQLIRDKIMGPVAFQNQGSDSFLKRNILPPETNVSSISSFIQSSFKSSFRRRNSRGFNNNSKSSFQSDTLTQEDTDEHLANADHCPNRITDYKIHPKTLYNEFPDNQNTDSKKENGEQSKIQNLVTQVPQKQQLYVKSNRSSDLSSNSNSPYQDQEPIIDDQKDIQNQQYQEDIIEFLQSDTHKMHLIQTLQSLQYVKTHLNQPPISEIRKRKVTLPPFKNKKITKTLIFDLDETLVHCIEDYQNNDHDHLITVNFPNGECASAGINIRPFVFECLKRASELFQIVVFTASHQSYADVVLDLLDPKNKIFAKRLYRESCIMSKDGVYVKDLRIFDQCRKIEDLIIVDNAVYSFGYQLENGIPIIPFYQEKDDEELLHLTQYLKCLVKNGGDVREHNRKAFQLRELSELDIQLFLQNIILETNMRRQQQNEDNTTTNKNLPYQNYMKQTPSSNDLLDVNSDVINEESNEEDDSAFQESRYYYSSRLSKLSLNNVDNQ